MVEQSLVKTHPVRVESKFRPLRVWCSTQRLQLDKQCWPRGKDERASKEHLNSKGTARKRMSHKLDKVQTSIKRVHVRGVRWRWSVPFCKAGFHILIFPITSFVSKWVQTINTMRMITSDFKMQGTFRCLGFPEFTPAKLMVLDPGSRKLSFRLL